MCPPSPIQSHLHHISSCRSSDGRKELHRLSDLLSGLEVGVRSRKAVDDTGHKPRSQRHRAERTKSEVDARRDKKPVLNPMSADEVD